MNSHYRYRKFIQSATWVAMLCCLTISVFFLVAILGYVIVNGASYINWEFLTALPVPAGESGGGRLSRGTWSISCRRVRAKDMVGAVIAVHGQRRDAIVAELD